MYKRQTFVAMSPIKPDSGNIKVQIYKAIVTGTNPIGLLKALRISSSIFDFVLLARPSRELRIIEIIKPLKRNAVKITNKEEIIEPRSIPKNPVFQTSEIRFIKFSIIMLLFYVYFINLSKIMSYLAALSFIK